MATAATSLLLLVFVAVSGAPAARAAVPVIHGFDPMEGPFGAPVTIYGEGFEGATAVLFDGVPAGFTVEDDELIATTVPEGLRHARVRVRSAGGTAWSERKFHVQRGRG